MNTSVSHRLLLGPSPFWKGLGAWVFGLGYCVGAWHVNKAAPLLGLALLGLAPFLNFYCFFRGLASLRRAWMRHSTLREALHLHLAPQWGSGAAGFFLVDDHKGVCVVNGRPLHFDAMDSLVAKSTHMAHTLEIRTSTAEKNHRPCILGFHDAAALRAGTERLHACIRAFTGKDVPLEWKDLTRAE